MDIHFNAYKIKYAIMDKLLFPIIRSKNIDSVNVFINLDDILHKLHRPQVCQEIQISGDQTGKHIISNILNIIAHYRQWCVRQGWETRVICYYTSAIHGGFKNNIYTPKYRKHFCEINHEMNSEYYFINRAIIESDKLIKIISQYIDKVYIIDSRFLEPSIVPLWFSEQVFKSTWNIIISRDLYDLQYSYIDSWIFLYPKGNDSKICDYTNLWKFLSEIEKINDNTNKDYEPSLYPIILTIVGQKYRNIPRLKRIGWKSIFKVLDRLSDISEDFSRTSMEILLVNEIKSKNTSIDDITNNLNSIDIQSQVYSIGEIEKTDLLAQIIDIPDYENLLEMNQLYFSKCPINLPFLTEQKERNRKKNNPFNLRK